MGVKLTYDANGFKGAEICLASDEVQTERLNKEYDVVKTVLTGVLGDRPISVGLKKKMNKNEKNEVTKKKRHRPKPNYSTDKDMAQRIVDAYGLKYLHGVTIDHGEQRFHFDRVDDVKMVIEDIEVERNTTVENPGVDVT